MLQAHSLLWHYLWLAPNIFLLCLGILLWKRGLHSRFPAFVAFSILSALAELALYAADVLPSVPPMQFWRVDWASLVLEGLLKVLVLEEIFTKVFGSYASLVKLGKTLIRAVAAIAVLVATCAAAYAPRDGYFAVVSGAHFLEQTIYIIESVLLLFIVSFAVYFHLAWDRLAVGITVGLSISACVHMAVWALLANAGLPESIRNILVLGKMGTYHFCVLLWCYYVLVPKKIAMRFIPALPENSLDLWNRELERLLQ
jgi:hypothetical protein